MFKNLNARKPIVGVTDYPTKINGLIDDLKNAANLPGLPFSYKEDTTIGLTLGLYGGQMLVNGALTTIADTSAAGLAPSTVNYIEHDAAGVVSSNAVGFSANKFPIGEATTDTTVITGYVDRRNLNTLLIPGRVSIAVGGGAGTTVLTAAQWRNDIIEFTGALTGARTIEVPALVSRQKIIYNATTGAFTLTVKTAAGTGKALAQGKRNVLYCDGVNVEQSIDDASSVGALPISGGALTGVLAIVDGTVGAPGLRVGTSSITGLFSSNDNSLRVATSGIEALRVTSGQNIGIGNTDPASRLHIKQSANGQAGGLKLERSDIAARYSIYHGGDGKLYLDSIDLGGSFVSFNGADIQPAGTSLPIQKSFTSADQVITSGGSLTLAHGLGAAPGLKVFVGLVCQTSELGYTAGQVLVANPWSGDSFHVGFGIITDATNLGIRFGSAVNVFTIPRFDTGVNSAITNANWRLRVTAFA